MFQKNKKRRFRQYHIRRSSLYKCITYSPIRAHYKPSPPCAQNQLIDITDKPLALPHFFHPHPASTTHHPRTPNQFPSQPPDRSGGKFGRKLIYSSQAYIPRAPVSSSEFTHWVWVVKILHNFELLALYALLFRSLGVS